VLSTAAEKAEGAGVAARGRVADDTVSGATRDAGVTGIARVSRGPAAFPSLVAVGTGRDRGNASGLTVAAGALAQAPATAATTTTAMRRETDTVNTEYRSRRPSPLTPVNTLFTFAPFLTCPRSSSKNDSGSWNRRCS
jgi:hypothetical protein